MAYDRSLKKKWDEYSIKETAFNDGKQEGIEEGKLKGIAEGSKQKAIDIAHKLLKLGLPLPQIAATTGLNEEEIEELSRKNSGEAGSSQKV